MLARGALARRAVGTGLPKGRRTSIRPETWQTDRRLPKDLPGLSPTPVQARLPLAHIQHPLLTRYLCYRTACYKMSSSVSDQGLAVKRQASNVRGPRKRGQVGPIDERPAISPMKRYVYGPLLLFSGAILGVILTTVWTAIILGVLQFFFQVDVTQVTGGTGQGLVAQLKGSSLVPVFNNVLFFLVRSLELFILDDSADILKRVVCTAFPNSC